MHARELRVIGETCVLHVKDRVGRGDGPGRIPRDQSDGGAGAGPGPGADQVEGLGVEDLE